ncbi:hypothetical protein EG832_01320 [bacterium]|nr:hypothetical protein [bacterium]
MKPNSFIILAMLLFSFTATLSEAGWLIYHKPEFRGKVIDAETKEPIEGAVVVVAYFKYTIGIAGRDTSVIKTKETITGNNGEFYFPAYTTVIQPLSGEDKAEFIIYKPGYGSFPNYQLAPSFKLTDQEKFFSRGIGGTGDLSGTVNTIVKVTFGIVELPKLKTRKERLRAMPSWPSESPGDKRATELPLLYKAIFEEDKRLGLRGEAK